MNDNESFPPGSPGRTRWRAFRKHPLGRIGAGIITGVADDDPSGIATYSQAGAQYGFDMLWTMPLSWPLMAGIQSICAQIGRVTGKGLAANIKATFPGSVLVAVVSLLLIANTLNIAADLAAMGEAAELVSGAERHGAAVSFGLATALLQVFIPYHRYVRYLRWLTLSLLAYAAVLFTVRIPWHEVALRTLWPRLSWDGSAATVAVGVFGTTISPYLFFWQASEEIEDLNLASGIPLARDGSMASTELRRIGWDTWGGMLYSNLASYFVILATAVTLHVAGVTDIRTAAQAAAALKPLAGRFAYELFAFGIIGVGLIGVPVLAGSAGYAVAESMGWDWGFERKARDARGFYLIIAACMLLALVLQFVPLSPLKALFWSAVINGVVAVPLMVVIILMARKRSVMGAYPVTPVVAALSWCATFVMGVAAICMFVLG